MGGDSSINTRIIETTWHENHLTFLLRFVRPALEVKGPVDQVDKTTKIQIRPPEQHTNMQEYVKNSSRNNGHIW